MLTAIYSTLEDLDTPQTWKCAVLSMVVQFEPIISFFIQKYTKSLRATTIAGRGVWTYWQVFGAACKITQRQDLQGQVTHIVVWSCLCHCTALVGSCLCRKPSKNHVFSVSLCLNSILAHPPISQMRSGGDVRFSNNNIAPEALKSLYSC